MVKINFQDNITKANAATFNTMQDNIEDAIDEVDEKTLDIYSTSETRVGTWINGKPLYRKSKVFSSSDTTFNYGGEKTLNLDISNVDEITNYKAYYKRSDGSFQQVPNSHSVMSYWGSSLYDFKTNGNCTFWIGTLYNVFTINYLVITIEYTKTTD